MRLIFSLAFRSGQARGKSIRRSVTVSLDVDRVNSPGTERYIITPAPQSTRRGQFHEHLLPEMKPLVLSAPVPTPKNRTRPSGLILAQIFLDIQR